MVNQWSKPTVSHLPFQPLNLSNPWGSTVSRLLEIMGFLQHHVLDLYGCHCLASPNKSQEVPFLNAHSSTISQPVPSFINQSQPGNGQIMVKSVKSPVAVPPWLPGFSLIQAVCPSPPACQLLFSWFLAKCEHIRLMSFLLWNVLTVSRSFLPLYPLQNIL